MPIKNTICVVGNPNCGKTTLFNGLTGSNQIVGNWPGVTVEKKSGDFVYKDRHITIVDLPGIYSLQPSSAASIDEKVARDYILQNEAELVVNIVDASNLERNLYLTAQLIEMRVPMIVVVNMLDVAAAHKIEINIENLQRDLNCKVVGIVASKEEGLKELCEAIDEQLDDLKTPPNPISFHDDITEAIRQIGALLAKQNVEKPQWVAEQLLEGDEELLTRLHGVDLTEAKKIIDALNEKYQGDLDIAMADARYSFVSEVAADCIIRKGEVNQSTTEKIDKFVLNRWLGIPFFLFVMYLMFVFSINIGSAFIDFFDILFGAIFVEGFGNLLTSWGTPDWVKTILADGIGGGIQTVSTFIPVIACLFLSLSFLEDSGYMARAAFVMDRLMRTLGLPGKSFVPLIVGFGCSVPAIMGARTMEKRSDRITTVLMAPFMSCGARLPVYVLFATAFWPLGGQNLVFSLYLIGIVVAIITGFVLKRTALKGAPTAFVMEIPPYHLPTIKTLAYRTWDRLKSFILKAGQLIVIIVAVLAFLNSLGTDGSFGNEDTDKSVLSNIGKTIVPAFEPMGMQQDNWPAAVGIFTGILAKEAVVGTLDSLYSGMGNRSAQGDDNEVNTVKEPSPAVEEEEKEFSIWESTKEAFATIPENLSKLGDFLVDPLGVNVEKDLTDVDEQAAEQEVGVGTIHNMKKLFDGDLGAFAYLVMVLLYIPCCASIGAMYREIGAKWTIFAAFWTSALGYGSATLIYQIGRFGNHPVYSSVCIAAVCLVFILIFAYLSKEGKGPVME